MFKVRYRSVESIEKCITFYASHLINNPAGPAVMVAPVGPVQRVQADRSAAAGRMHEAAFAHIDAYMADAAGRAEENQIGRRQAALIDARPLDLG